jgi:hypothetical protein
VKVKEGNPQGISYEGIYKQMVTTWISVGKSDQFTENSLVDTLQLSDKNEDNQTTHVFSRAMIRQEDISAPEATFIKDIISLISSVKITWKPTTKIVATYSNAMDELFDIMYENVDRNDSSYNTPIKCYSNQTGFMTISEYPELTINGIEAETLQHDLASTYGYTITHMKLAGDGWFIVSLKETAEKVRTRTQKANQTKRELLGAYYTIMMHSEKDPLAFFYRPYPQATLKLFYEKHAEYGSPESIFSEYPSRLFFCFGNPQFNNYDHSLNDLAIFLRKNLRIITSHAMNGFVDNKTYKVMYSLE